MNSLIHSTLANEFARPRRTGRWTRTRDGLAMRWVRP